MAKERETNIELARILSMFFVLMIHANMVSLPIPTNSDLELNTVPTVFRFYIESLGVVCVNVFVLISGWFTIKTSTKSVLSFVFQVLFFWGGAYVFFVLLGKTPFSLNGVLGCFAFTKWGFFIKAYLVMFILAPILNIYVQNSPEKLQRMVLLGFFIYVFTYGWLGGASRFFVNGYGPLFFIGLYLLAQYAHCSTSQTTPAFIRRLVNMDNYIYLSVYILTCIANTFLCVLSIKYNPFYFNYVISFVNPLVVIGSLSLLMFFSKLKVSNNVYVNWIAISSFAVYLLHSQINIRTYFTKIVCHLYNTNNGFICVLVIFSFLVLVHLISVFIDKIRIFSWNRISEKLF